MKKIAVILSITALIQGCATIVKSPNTIVTFQGDPNVSTKIMSPYGSTTLKNGIGSLVMKNSRDDINLQIICGKDQPPVSVILKTRYSVGAGVFGNLGLLFLWVIPGIVGFVVDGSGNVAYEPTTPFNVSQYCHQ